MKWLATRWLKALGWTPIHTPPPSPHGIIIAYPHTSNWDFFYSVLWKVSVGCELRWVAKSSLFFFPLGIFMRMLGAIGVSRQGGQNNVTALSHAMLKHTKCWLAIAPEGTRSHRPYIKSGFYHIARAAAVPIGIGFIDYEKKEVGIRYYRMVKDNFAEELTQLAEDYAAIKPYDASKVCDLKMRVTSDTIISDDIISD